jgi:hypothetical protein
MVFVCFFFVKFICDAFHDSCQYRDNITSYGRIIINEWMAKYFERSGPQPFPEIFLQNWKETRKSCHNTDCPSRNSKRTAIFFDPEDKRNLLLRNVCLSELHGCIIHKTVFIMNTALRILKSNIEYMDSVLYQYHWPRYLSRLRTGGPRVRSTSPGRDKIFLLSMSSRPVLGPTQPSMQRVRVLLFSTG